MKRSNDMKKLAYGVMCFAAMSAAIAWADPATDYVSESSGKATIIDLGDQFAVASKEQSQFL